MSSRDVPHQTWHRAETASGALRAPIMSIAERGLHWRRCRRAWGGKHRRARRGFPSGHLRTCEYTTRLA
eukprot:9940171-Karenia_brevis.AAC.1